MTRPSALLLFQPATMTSAQLAAVSYLARYGGRTHALYSFQLRQWFAWCESNGLDPLVGIQRAHVELYIRALGERLMDSSITTMMHAVRGYFRFAHIDGLIPSDPAVHARLPRVHRDETRTQGLDRLELTRFLQVAQTLSVHHGALAYLLGINALRASEAAAVRIEDYADTLRGYRILHLLGKGNKTVTPLMTSLLDQSYTTKQATYDLRRLRRKGLIERQPHSNRYLLTDRGRCVAVLFTKTYGRVLAPGLAAFDPRLPADLAQRSPLATAWRALNRELAHHIDRGLAAA